MTAWRRLRVYADWRRFKISALILALCGLALCFVPLLNVLGYELALVVAIVAAIATGVIAAAYPQRVREQLAPFPGAQWTVLRLYAAVAGYGLALLVAPLALISLNALRVPNCDFVEGLGFYLLGPVGAVLVAAAWGLAAGLLAPGRRTATALWLLVFVGAVALVLHELWATPSVRLLGSFHGYFSGVLYDEEVAIPLELATLRLRDVLQVAAILAACAWLLDRSRLRLSLKAGWEGRRRLVAAGALAAAFALCVFFGPELGHRHSAAAVARALGGRTVSGRCVVIHPATLRPEDARLVAQDCEFRLDQVERFFDTRLDGTLTVYLFDSPEQKQALMGAGGTSVAKPWRREVYIQGARFPHPVLEHEIAHVVAGAFGARPLRVSGRLGGALVSPGLIEGAAVAAAWSDDELTPHAWSRAMHDLDVAPPIGRVLGLSFLGVNASRAYVLAGSFSRFLIERYGAADYREAYRTTDVERVYGKSVGELEREWLEFLDTVELRPGDVDLARQRFDRPAVFSKRCAHEVAQLRERAWACEADGDWRRAVALRHQVEGYTGGDGLSKLELARSLLGAGDVDEASRLLERLAGSKVGPSTPRDVLRAAQEHLADLAWADGRRDAALEAYRELARGADFEADRRLLTVKIRALEDERAEPFLRSFLVGGPQAGPEPPELAVLTLSELIDERPDSGLGHYLLGRQVFLNDHFDRALPYLRRAQELELPNDEIRAENRRLLAIASFRAGRIDEARTLFRGLADDETRPSGARAQALDWIERCDWVERRR